jgi:hypothetical protein
MDLVSQTQSSDRPCRNPDFAGMAAGQANKNLNHRSDTFEQKSVLVFTGDQY